MCLKYIVLFLLQKSKVNKEENEQYLKGGMCGIERKIIEKYSLYYS